MLPVLQVGPAAIQAPGLILLFGLWLGLSLAERFSARRGVSANHVNNLVLITLAFGIIGGRLIYVLRHSAVFMESPISLLSLNPGLFSAADGAVIGILAGWVYASRKRLPLWPLLDSITPALNVLAVATGLSHLASGLAFGSPAQLPWAIELWGASRHPTQVYETLAAAGILILLWPGRQRINAWPPGRYFLSFIALFAGSRLVLEAFRGDSLLISGGFRLVQVVALLVLILSLVLIARQSKQEQVSSS